MIGDADVLEPLKVLLSVASPHGAERELAEAVVRWGRVAAPDAAWDVDAIDERSANVFARASSGQAPRELAIYGHLDTSLTGDARRDRGITGTDAPPAPFEVRGRAVRGFGVGVAKAPTAAGIAAFIAAARALRGAKIPHRLTLLLAATGTHRADPDTAMSAFGRGVAHALDAGWKPDAVLNVKAGPRGVLREEPAAAYLRVALHDRWDAALARRVVAPDGGLARHADTVIGAIEDWRARYLAAHPARGQLAPEIAIGAIRSGSPEKPDLLPGSLELFLYAVLLPDADAQQVARELASALAPVAAALPRSPRVSVDVYAYGPGGATDDQSAIVRHATAAWRDAFGDLAPVTAWSGATDGALLLARGIPTARMGPQVTRGADDPRIESVSLDDLVQAARAYADTAVRFFREAA
ncbi:MAG TPA: M20/M25/M40 family metallo-hydrolase [Candidatus Acidoferrales bacterium]|nr:M20/M25/M40 family metallo-hydrolase [Candidatus Acidoferrales bacterium]